MKKKFYLTLKPKIEKKAKNIKILILDVDGVLTNGSLFFGCDDSFELKGFNTLDGLGLVQLKKTPIKTAIITGRKSKPIQTRSEQLKIDFYREGIADKKIAFEELLDSFKLKPEQCAYIGDDVNDYSVLKAVGLSIAVKNAHEIIKSNVDYVTRKEGGKGAVREVCDILLYCQNHYFKLMEDFLLF